MGRRLLWFAGLWLAGVLVVASVGFAIKLIIG
jgi:preprotein translocase subunit Sss1